MHAGAAAGAELAGEGAAMTADVDFATHVLLRLVTRLFDAEEENKRWLADQKSRQTKWVELYELLGDQPEYEQMRKGASVDSLEVAIAVLRRFLNKPAHEHRWNRDESRGAKGQVCDCGATR